MAKPKTYIKAIRINGNVIDTWELLKTYKIRSAEIFKEAGSKAIEKKLIELKIELKKEILPF